MLQIRSQITFFYYKDIASAHAFYSDIMGFEVVEDQGWAKVYQVSEGAFVGIVDETRGHRNANQNEDSAVLLTLVTDDVRGWYDYMVEKGVKLVREYGFSEEIQVEYCFFEDPGGYGIEIQKFHKPELASIFNLENRD